MSLPSALRPSLKASARCSSRALATPRSGAQWKRSVSTATVSSDQKRLETPSDWDEFRQKKGQTKMLIDMMSEYGSTQNSSNTFQLRDQLHKPARHATISALLAAGAHFGHASSRMNPNFMPYAYGTRAGITIIDLDSTLPLLRRAANVTRAVARAGGQILFIGTRPDLKPIVQKAAERVGPEQGYYVGDRWLPGTLTNRREFFRPEQLANTNVIPDLAIILNPVQNANAIREFAVENVPTIGIIDSNVDPRLVMYPIPANDENTRAAELIGGVLSIAAREGVELREQEDMARLKQQQKKFRQRTSRFK
ncbi:mitochondrial ribosomal protein subunit S2 [Coprinopsis cinerea okayama7|uniref:Mitochondrial ribosomal protein subunit S2 n=1 Tax=Coprinopsis cinerea (strain Okayama-7 / 130 / ATCC MYA-4618 / FGSC 9003) TaxID=240176 RepID=A8NHH0_COPC7|nr:mitochondrial 37S ribosomal protein MRP4 [Coprinopsis cinerea okayama7\|eukprot:XP_001833758.1 mitochondrial 37S ribosomal protein MRP4 [Coprinopsis cinerea okayama7\